MTTRAECRRLPTMNIFIHHDWRKKEGKYRQQTNKHWRDLTNLTKNNVQQYDNDIKKNIWLTLILKYLSMLLLHLNFLQNLLLFVSSISIQSELTSDERQSVSAAKCNRNSNLYLQAIALAPHATLQQVMTCTANLARSLTLRCCHLANLRAWSRATTAQSIPTVTVFPYCC